MLYFHGESRFTCSFCDQVMVNEKSEHNKQFEFYFFVRKLGRGSFQSLGDVLNISGALYKADNQTQFGLVTFSSVQDTYIHRHFGQDQNYSEWQSYLTAFASGIQNPNSSFYPFFQASSYLT